MKSLLISDDVYEKLKAFVVDPFDDNPDAVLMRLIDIATKAQNRWCPFTQPQNGQEQANSNGSVPEGTRIYEEVPEETAVML